MELVLPAQVNREVVLAFANQAKEAFQGGTEAVRLDASAAASVHPAMLQLILAMGRSAREAGRSFTLVAPSGELIDNFQSLGLFADLMTISME